MKCGRGRTASTDGILGPLVREVNFTQVDVHAIELWNFRGAVDTAQVNISGNGNNQQHLSNHNIYIYVYVFSFPLRGLSVGRAVWHIRLSWP